MHGNVDQKSIFIYHLLRMKPATEGRREEEGKPWNPMHKHTFIYEIITAFNESEQWIQA